MIVVLPYAISQIYKENTEWAFFFLPYFLIGLSVFLNEVSWYLNCQQAEQIMFLITLIHNFSC